MAVASYPYYTDMSHLAREAIRPQLPLQEHKEQQRLQQAANAALK